jgi:hypothetical protein
MALSDLRNWTKDIRFWILLYFIIRLFHITQPPLETAHNWRQSTGLMVSRNFYEIDANILYPRLDNGGEKTGITGTEFPLFNYLIYLFAKLFGWADWYGRFINLIVSSFGIYWFYLLLARYIRPQVAFYASFVLLNSLWFAYSRKTMPDTFAMSLIIGGLLYALDYLYKGKFWRLLLFAFLSLCGLLSKIPVGFVWATLLLPFLDRDVKISRKIVLAVAGAVIMVPVGWWYFIWVPYLVQHFGFWHYYMGTSIGQGAREVGTHLDQAIQKFYFCALNFIGFATFLGGLIYAIRQKEKRLLWAFFLCFAAFFVFILKAGFAFYHHNYYIMPFVPVMAMVAGYAISSIPKTAYRYILMLAIATEVIINALPEFRINADQRYKLTLESVAAQYTAPNDLIAINCGTNPQQVYLLHRKGWDIENNEAQDATFMADLKAKGCKVLFINKHEGNVKPLPYQKLGENQDLIIYKL